MPDLTTSSKRPKCASTLTTPCRPLDKAELTFDRIFISWYLLVPDAASLNHKMSHATRPKYHKDYNDPEADIVLKSWDGIRFRVHAYYLKASR